MGFVLPLLPDIKRIYVYVNGDPYQPATNIIVHPRRIRNFEVFLKDLTEKLRPPYGAVRNVYTPVNGSRIRDLEDLENHQNYVAAGKESFRKLDYIDIEEMQAKRKVVIAPTHKPVKNVQKVTRPFRRRPYNWEPMTIYLYRNGDDVSPAKKLHFTRSDLENWDTFLLKVGDKLDQQGFIRRLYNFSGEWIRHPSGIQNSQQYVGVSGYDQFQKVMYGKLIHRLPKEFLNEIASKSKQVKPETSPTVSTKKTVAPVKLPKFMKRPKLGNKDEASKKKDVGAINRKLVAISKPKGTVGDKDKTVQTIASKHRVEYIKKPSVNLPIKMKTTSFPAIKKGIKAIESDKRETDKKLKEKRTALHKTNEKLKKDGKSPDSEDSAYMSENEGRKKKSKQTSNGVYFAPTKKIRPKKVTMVNYDEDSGGIYRARTRHTESKNAKEVHELRHLPVELPIDEVEADEIGAEVLTRHEEVDEEEEETEDDVKDSSEDEVGDHRKRHSSEKEVTSLDSNDAESPQRKPKQTDESNYPLAYNRELQASARTA